MPGAGAPLMFTTPRTGELEGTARPPLQPPNTPKPNTNAKPNRLVARTQRKLRSNGISLVPTAQRAIRRHVDILRVELHGAVAVQEHTAVRVRAPPGEVRAV